MEFIKKKIEIKKKIIYYSIINMSQISNDSKIIIYKYIHQLNMKDVLDDMLSREDIYHKYFSVIEFYEYSICDICKFTTYIDIIIPKSYKCFFCTNWRF